MFAVVEVVLSHPLYTVHTYRLDSVCNLSNVQAVNTFTCARYHSACIQKKEQRKKERKEKERKTDR